ncbi:hypothetical protein RCH18_003104 [Flavobacterium sp. PL11]|jgi:hypothetical protein|nr:hypothetical protein [Flavobacterium sp. PL11]
MYARTSDNIYVIEGFYYKIYGKAEIVKYLISGI